MASSEQDGACGKDHMDTIEKPVLRSDETYGITTDVILRHKEMLTDTLQDTKYGILEKLLASGGLTHRETTAIANFSTDPYERSSKLLEVVLQRNILSQFITALVDTDQKHLVNYLRGDGVFNAEFGDDWLLGQDRIRQLDRNREYLIIKIDARDSGLIHILWSAKVINERQYSFTIHEKDPCEVNSVLLDIIRRQSLKQYNDTIVCLNESKQYHIAEILKKTGVIQKIRISQEGDPRIVDETEVALSDRLADLLRDLPLEEANRELEMAGERLKIIAVQKGKSIYLYVYCATLEELIELHNLLVTGAVKAIVETLFNKLVSREDPIVVSYTYSEEEFDKCRSYFEEMESTLPEIQVKKVETGPTHSESSAVIQRIRVSQEEDPQIVNQIEDTLVDRLTELFRDRSIEDARRILEMAELKTIATKKGE